MASMARRGVLAVVLAAWASAAMCGEPAAKGEAADDFAATVDKPPVRLRPIGMQGGKAELWHGKVVGGDFPHVDYKRGVWPLERPEERKREASVRIDEYRRNPLEGVRMGHRFPIPKTPGDWVAAAIGVALAILFGGPGRSRS